MTTLDLPSATGEFLKIIERLKPGDVNPFLAWLRQNVNEHHPESDNQSSTDVILESIRNDLRTSLPLEAVSQTENITFPKIGPNSDCDPKTTVHVDAFLYDEDAIDELNDEGKLSRNYCVDCMSHNVKPLTFVTHSASVNKVKYIFQYLLTDLRNKTVLDVGSRTGAMLYGAQLFSEAPKIIGVEIDVSFCQLQTQLISKYSMTDRIQIINADIRNQEHLLHLCDVIIMNNVFEFFSDQTQQQKIWIFLRQVIQKPGTILITTPSILESIADLQTGIDINSWLVQTDTEDVQKIAEAALFSDSGDSDLDNTFMYKVI